MEKEMLVQMSGYKLFALFFGVKKDKSIVIMDEGYGEIVVNKFGVSWQLTLPS